MTEPARFGRVAWAYRWMEYLCFGPYLERCRNQRLSEISNGMPQARRALIYGDGDGRFLARLARAAPDMEITAVDASGAMLRRAANRLPLGVRVTLHQADALRYTPEAEYELIVSHFFLDCFIDAEVAMLLERVRPAVRPGTVWIVSDFALPPGLIAGIVGRWVVGGLYLAFKLLTGLRTQRLPDYTAAMRAAGWQKEDQRHLLAGLLVSERWKFFGAPS